MTHRDGWQRVLAAAACLCWCTLLPAQDRTPIPSQPPYSRAQQPLKLPKPAQHDDESTGGRDKKRTAASYTTTVSVLIGLLFLIVLVAKLLKKHGPAALHGLPHQALEILGKRHLDQRNTVHLVRLGARILVLGSSTNGLNSLAEIVDPVEVDYLAGLCRSQVGEAGIVRSFQQLFDQHAHDGTRGASAAHRPNAGLSSPDANVAPSAKLPKTRGDSHAA